MTDRKTRRGADLLVQGLQQAGVSAVFSLSGNQIMPVYDALLGSGIRLIHVRHETAAVYMAEAWAQLTGQVGVALVTAGAGLGNALGALVSAQASETPVLLLSGDSPRAQDGMGAFQELDQAAMARPVTKLAARSEGAGALPAELARALRTARAGRPGPVHLALPVDVLTAAAAAETPSADPPVQALARDDAARAARWLAEAARPLVLLGPALSPTRTGLPIRDVEAALGAPVVCLESARGLADPAAGALVELMCAADRVLLLGKRADFTVGFLGAKICAATTRFAAIDPERAELDRVRARIGDRLDLALQADALPALRALMAEGGAPARPDWRATAKALLERRAAPPEPGAAGPGRLHPAEAGAVVERLLAAHPDTVLVCDGGEFGQWMQAVPHSCARVVNGPSGAIGAAPAYAMAAALARPGAPVLAVMGDGTAGFLLAEYETAAREGLRFTALVGNDALWNAEHQIQLRDYGADRAHGCALSQAARYDRAAVALGGQGVRVASDDPADLAAALDAALRADGPTCIDLAICPAPAPRVGAS